MITTTQTAHKSVPPWQNREAVCPHFTAQLSEDGQRQFPEVPSRKGRQPPSVSGREATPHLSENHIYGSPYLRARICESIFGSPYLGARIWGARPLSEQKPPPSGARQVHPTARSLIPHQQNLNNLTPPPATKSTHRVPFRNTRRPPSGARQVHPTARKPDLSIPNDQHNSTSALHGRTVPTHCGNRVCFTHLWRPQEALSQIPTRAHLNNARFTLQQEG